MPLIVFILLNDFVQYRIYFVEFFFCNIVAMCSLDS